MKLITQLINHVVLSDFKNKRDLIPFQAGPPLNLSICLITYNKVISKATMK